MKFIGILFGLLFVCIIGLHRVLKDGSLMRYLDTHRHETRVPAVQYALGGGYYLFGDLQNSATFYQRVYQQYPKSSYAEDAYFSYLKSLDDMNIPRGEMAELYVTYLELYPEGKYELLVKKRIELYRNMR